MSDNPKPTPPSGMPAAAPASGAPPPTTEEITAPKSEATVAILEAIGSLRDETKLRISALEATFDQRFRHLETRVEVDAARTSAAIASQAEALSRVAVTAARACDAAARGCDAALEAKTIASNAEAGMQSTVDAALRYHRNSIASVVDVAVKQAVEPLASEVSEVRTSGNERAKQIEETQKSVLRSNEALGAVVDELGLEGQVELGRDIRPGEPKPQRTLAKMSRENKAGAVAAGLACLTAAIELAMQVLHH